MRGAGLKAVQELLGHASLAMTMRYAHLSHEHLKDSVNLLNNLPSGKQIVNIGLEVKKADNPSIANLL
jgi:hypothetical protein